MKSSFLTKLLRSWALRVRAPQGPQPSPLEVIIDQHLNLVKSTGNFITERESLVGPIMVDYFNFLESNRIAIPNHMAPILAEQWKNEILRRIRVKTYGMPGLTAHRS